MRTIRWFLSYLVPVAIIVIGIGTYVYWDRLDEVWEKTSEPFVALKQKWQQAFNDEKEAEQKIQTVQAPVQHPGFMPPNARRGPMFRSGPGSISAPMSPPIQGGPMQRGAMPPRALPPHSMQAGRGHPGMMGRPPMQKMPPSLAGHPNMNQPNMVPPMGRAMGIPPRPGMNPMQSPRNFMMPFKVSAAEKLTDKQVTQLKQARKAYWLGDLKDATAKYNKLLDGDQKNPDVLGEMGNVQWAMGDKKAAGETYFKAGKQFVLYNNFMRVRFVRSILVQIAPDKAKQLDEQARAHFKSLMKNKTKG